MNKILYVADEGIGNTVMATPVVHALREIFPMSHITFGTRSSSLSIPVGLVDEIIDVTKEKEKLKYDTILCSAWHYYFLKRKNEFKCTHFKKVEFKAPVKEHEAELNMRLIEGLGYISEMGKTYCHVKQPKYFEVDDSKINICFVNGCIGPPWERKEWPNDFEFFKYLRDNMDNYCLYILGGTREADKYNRWKEIFPNEDEVNLCGMLDVDECAWVMQNSDVTIANDTGLCHVAAAIDAQLLVLWGPTSLQKNEPLGDNVTFLMNEGLDCLICQYTSRWDRCKDWKCMSDLKPEDVFVKMLRILNVS